MFRYSGHAYLDPNDFVVMSATFMVNIEPIVDVYSGIRTKKLNSQVQPCFSMETTPLLARFMHNSHINFEGKNHANLETDSHDRAFKVDTWHFALDALLQSSVVLWYAVMVSYMSFSWHSKWQRSFYSRSCSVLVLKTLIAERRTLNWILIELKLSFLSLENRSCEEQASYELHSQIFWLHPTICLA